MTSLRNDAPVAVLELLVDGRSLDTRHLLVGEELTFGRAPSTDVWVHSPWISRRAGSIFAGPHFVTVTRFASATGPGVGKLWLNTFDSEAPVLIPAGGTVAIDTRTAEVNASTTDPSGTGSDAILDLNAFFGQPIMRITVSQPLRHLPDLPNLRRALLDPTWATLETLRANREFPVLVALCDPLFDVTPNFGGLPSNAQIARRLTKTGASLAQDTVRNQLYKWRCRLGIENGAQAGVASYHLAVVAKGTGLVTERDVDELRILAPVDSE